MDIEFKWERFYEDDKADWEALFVKTSIGGWHMAKPAYGTEDEDEILQFFAEQNMEDEGYSLDNPFWISHDEMDYPDAETD